jgi:hypothetical protein
VAVNRLAIDPVDHHAEPIIVGACRTVRTRGTSFILPIGNQKDGSNDKGSPRYSAQAQGAAPC